MSDHPTTHDLMLQCHAQSERTEQHVAELDQKLGVVMGAVARLESLAGRLESAIRGNGQPGALTRIALLEQQCGDCDALDRVHDLAAAMRERQVTLAEIAPMQVARTSARSAIIVALIAASSAAVGYLVTARAAAVAQHRTGTTQLDRVP